MLDIIRKSMLAGIGLLTLSQEKARELVDELVKQGEVSKEEGSKLLKEFLEKVDKNTQELEKKVNELLQKTLTKMNIPTKEELEKLRREIESLKQQLAEKGGTPGAGQG
jgi:polyhydroxyalkanoate synthesis regulator phasin